MPTSKKTPKKTVSQSPVTPESISTFIDSFKNELQCKAKQCLYDNCNFIFEHHPHVECIRWRQYTPATCDFEPFDRPSEYRVDNLEYKDRQRNEWIPAWGDILASNELLDDITKVENLLDVLPLSLAFGDHVRVTIDRNQTSVEDFYEQDQ